MGNKFHNLTHSSLQLEVVYNFSEIKSIFSVPFWDYVTEYYRSVAWFPYVWKGKLNKTDSSMKDFFICWLFFFYIGCNLAALPNVLPRQQQFPTSFCHETFQNICCCNLISISLPQIFHEGKIEDRSFINFFTRCFARMI